MITPVLLHVDMDAFYVSVELRDHPELAGRPVWVGGAERGVVLSASYEARDRGVSGGMSVTRARRLCPEAVAIPPDFDRYAAVSRGIFAIFDRYSPTVEAVSNDEAFIDVTGARRLYATPTAIAELIRAQVADEQGISCSVGIGPTKLVAKMASQQAKPSGTHPGGICEVSPAGVTAFLHPLPVEALWGVGEATATALHRYGLRTVGDLANTRRATLQRAFGYHQGTLLADYAWGRDPRRVTPRPPERSIGSEETFSRDTDDPDIVTAEILRMTDRTTHRMRRARVLGRTVVLGLRFADFTSITRSVTLPTLTDSADAVYPAALALWRNLGLQRARIRRVGVRVEGLVDKSRAFQQCALDAPERGWRDAEHAMDQAMARFGPGAVQRARLAAPLRSPRRMALGSTDRQEGDLH